MKQISVTPAPANARSVQSSRRRPFTSAKHLGVSAVVGINRRPRPAPMMMTFMTGSISPPVKTPETDFGEFSFRMRRQRYFTRCARVPQAGDDQGTAERANRPEAHGEWPAVILSETARQFVAGGGAQVAHEIHEPRGRRRRAASRQIHRQCADQEDLRNEDAE